jgi:pectin methylesterase-like acyl-CoA thioesterase
MPALVHGAACAAPARRRCNARRSVATRASAPHAHPPAAALPRRAALALPPLAAALAALLPPAARADDAAATAPSADAPLFLVRPGPDDPSQRTYGTINAALDAAPAGATVRVAAGYYGERLVITRPVTLEAAPGAEGRSVVEHATELPYEATLQVRAGGMAGVRHHTLVADGRCAARSG